MYKAPIAFTVDEAKAFKALFYSPRLSHEAKTRLWIAHELWMGKHPWTISAISRRSLPYIDAIVADFETGGLHNIYR